MPTLPARFRLAYENFVLDVDLQLPSTGVTVLFGPSGSGKTTLLRCIAGLEKAPIGYFEIKGQCWQDSSKNHFKPTYQRNLGYVFQEANLFPHLSVMGNLQFGVKRQTFSTVNSSNFQEIIDLLGIEHLLNRKPDRLSGGEKQRVVIARALLLKPDLLLMDEPLAALDQQRKQEILPFLIRLHQHLSIPVIYVTHSQTEVAQLADTLVVMQAGKVVANGNLTDTFNRIDLSFAQDKGASSVWQGTLSCHETKYHLSCVAINDNTLSLPLITAPIGTNLRIQIYARDVSITLAAPAATSILNILPAVVKEIKDDNKGQCTVFLQVGQQTLLAHITQKSAQLLNLRPELAVYVQIKGTSLLG